MLPATSVSVEGPYFWTVGISCISQGPDALIFRINSFSATPSPSVAGLSEDDVLGAGVAFGAGFALGLSSPLKRKKPPTPSPIRTTRPITMPTMSPDFFFGGG